MFKVALVHIDEPTHKVPDWVKQRIESQSIDLAFRQCNTSAEVSELAADADVIWVWGGSKLVRPEMLADFSRCKAIIRTGSGTDNIPVTEATARGILVVNTPQATSDPVSDHTIALMLSVYRWIPRQDRNLREGGWVCKDLVWDRHLHGSTLGFIGFGRIPQCVARKLSGFDLKYLAHDPQVSPDVMAKLQASPATFEEVLQQADVISLHTPLTEATHHLIGEHELRLMKSNVILINTSRGPVLDEQALVEALTERRIAGAALDVFETEPLPESSPLRQLDNVVLTPHVAGYTDEFIKDFWHYSVEAVCDMAQGFLPESYVNPQAVDRCGFVRRDQD